MKRNTPYSLFLICASLFTTISYSQENNLIGSQYDYKPEEKAIFLDGLPSESIGGSPAKPCLTQKSTTDENLMIDEFFLLRLVINKKQIVSNDVSKVFSGSFIEVKAGFSDGDGTAYCRDKLVNLKDDKVVFFNREGVTMLPFIRDDFFLSGEADAQSFNNALNKIVNTRSGMINSEFRRKDNKWYFIRDIYYDSETESEVKGGFVITTDQKSKIIGIEYESNIEKSK